MPLPTSTTSTAGTTNVIQNVPGTAGYTGSYTFIDPGGNYPQSALDNAVQIRAGGIGSNQMAGSGNGKGGFGIKLPDFSGLDRALGVLGAAIALGQTLMSIPATLQGIANNFVAFGKDLQRTAQGLLRFPNMFTKAVTDATKPDAWFTSDRNNQDWRVRISTNFDLLTKGTPYGVLSPIEATNGAVFPLTPNITINHKASYTTTEPMHNNFAYQGYKYSNVEDITISGEFPVNTHRDGLYWIAATTFFKSATKMFYGNSSPQGAPPIVCRLNGYGAHIFNNVPVVIKSFQVELKDNVSYKMISASEMISTSQAGVNSVAADKNVTWVPMMSTITIVVSPVYNREKIRQFSLNDYANGAYNGVL